MFVTRKLVCDRLRMSLWSSYQAANGLRPRRSHMIPLDDVADLLNRSARGGMRHVDATCVPDALTADEVSEETGVPARRIILATRRERNPIPHWRINSHLVRFDLQSATEWLGGER